MFWFWLWEPGDLFWDFVAGLGLVGAVGGLATFSPGLFLVGAALLFAVWRWS